MEIKPIRAWCEYDDLTGYLEFRDEWLEWTWAEIPKGLSGEFYSDKNEVNSVIEAVGAWGNERSSGPLRSLRVLLSNGYELRLSIFEDRICQWALNNGGVDYTKRIANGMFTENTDSEAVDRVLADAVAWFGRESK